MGVEVYYIFRKDGPDQPDPIYGIGFLWDIPDLSLRVDRPSQIQFQVSDPFGTVWIRHHP